MLSISLCNTLLGNQHFDNIPTFFSAPQVPLLWVGCYMNFVPDNVRFYLGLEVLKC